MRFPLLYNTLAAGIIAGALVVIGRDPTSWRRAALSASIAAFAVAASALVMVGTVEPGDPFAVMQLVAWGLFVHGAIGLFGAAFLLRRTQPRLAGAALVLGLGIAGIGVDAFFWEPGALEVNRHVLLTDKLSEPLVIAVIADLQTDRVGEHERRALLAAQAENPDLVIFPGDYVQATPGERPAVVAALNALLREVDLQPRFGAFAVQGNVDPSGWETIFEGTAITPTSRSMTAAAGPIDVTALSFRAGFTPTLRIPPSERFHLVFAHGPDFALGDVWADLLVAGHTHGGQVQLPVIGPLITLSAVPRSWASGRTDLPGGRTLVVSRGVGMERGNAPRLRFLCRPEVVILELRPKGT